MCLLAGGLAFGAGSAASWLLSRSASTTGGSGTVAAETLPALVTVALDETVGSSGAARTVHIAARIAFGALTWGWVSWAAADESRSTAFRFEEQTIPLESRHHAAFDTSFRVDGISRYAVSMSSSLSYRLDVAQYRDANGVPRRAIVHLPETRAQDAPASGLDPYRFRREAWNDLSQSVLRHTGERAMFVGWWDNMQRLHLHTGRRGRPRYPDADGYPRSEQRELWKSIAGGFVQDESLSCLSGQLLKDADEALAGIAECAWGDENGPVYLLISTDDLSHIQEMGYLAGRGIPLETRLFSSEGDIHGVVTSVNAWAGHGGGTGSYLVQPAPGFAVRAWKVTDTAFENSLLVRLLPFSSSLERDSPEHAKLVYQSSAGGYLSVYEITGPR